MSILYKYLSTNVDDKYLENPTFRLSTPNDLNDPFECNIAIDIKNLLTSNPKVLAEIFYIKTIPVAGEIIRKIIDEINKINLESELKRQSIISLTETHRDILMWSHYASNHQGTVVGYDVNVIIEHIKKKHPNYSEFTLEPNIYKINYRNTRFEDLEYSGGFRKTKSEITRELLKIVTTTKSDNWIYEKEHRLIIPLGCADVIRLFPIDYHGKRKQAERDKDASQAIESALIKSNITYKEYTEINIDSSSKIDDVESYINKLKNYFRVVPLMSIPKESIRTIHFGARADNARKINPLKILSNTPEYKFVRAYEYAVSDERFDLIPSLMKNDTFDGDKIDAAFEAVERAGLLS
ncbi:DUF2971 domain-containing protein [Aeromonas salmonicida]|uniref:DUF2971 domain-containing protein n=1 Tax=Aeromonas salmonicida TaxID=645 RepID=UPI0038BD6B6D